MGCEGVRVRATRARARVRVRVMVRAWVRVRALELPSRIMTSFSGNILKDSSAARRSLLLGVGSMRLVRVRVRDTLTL